MSTPDYISIILAVAAVAAIYLPRIPLLAPTAAFAALLTAHFAAGIPDSSTLAFWGVAEVIALGLGFLNGRRSGRGNAYVATGTIAGTLLGFLLAPTSAALICGGAAGALLAAIAYVRTPGAQRIGIASRAFVDFVAARALPAIITCTMAAIAILASIH